MKVRTEKLIIELEENEIDDFLNIIEFALDYHVENKRMTPCEEKLARELAEITHKLIC